MVRGAGLEPARYCYHQPLKLACLPFHHPRIVHAGRSHFEGLGAPAQQRKSCDYLVDPGVTAPAGL
jgi:hypothetical protein